LIGRVLVTLRILDSEKLLRRLCRAEREIFFLVGAPLSKPYVPDVGGMIAKIRARLEPGEVGRDDSYQEAFQKLIDADGADKANELVRFAVLEACDCDAATKARAIKGDVDVCEQLERQSTWSLTPALKALGQLVARHESKLGRTILTTNFDPLIRIAIRRAGASEYRVVLDRDGSLNQFHADGCRVIHAHGHWALSDTLHTPKQLMQERPQLSGSLQDFLANRLLVVLAYGGWEDVFTRTIFDLVADGGVYPDVLWTFFSNDSARIQQQLEKDLAGLKRGINRERVALFGGIDCQTFFPELLTRLDGSSAVLMSPTTSGLGTRKSSASPASCSALVVDLLKNDRGKWDLKFHEAIAEVDFRYRGLGQRYSSPWQAEIVRVARASLEERAEGLLKAWKRTISAPANLMSADQEEAIKQQAARQLEEAQNEVMAILAKHIDSGSPEFPHLSSRELVDLSNDLTSLSTKFFAELQLGIRARDRDLTKPPPPTAPRLSPSSRGPSPFIVGPVIERDEDFIGREAQKQQLIEAVTRGQPVQILGESRMGKTSLLHWLKRHGAELQDRPVVWIQAQGLAGKSPAGLVAAVAEQLGRRDRLPAVLPPSGRELERIMVVLLPMMLLVDEAEELVDQNHLFDHSFLVFLRQQCQDRRLLWASTSRSDLQTQFGRVGKSSKFLNDSARVLVGQLEHGDVVDVGSSLPDRATPNARDFLRRALSDKEKVDDVARRSGWIPLLLQSLAEKVRSDIPIDRGADQVSVDQNGNLQDWWNHRSGAEQALLKRLATSPIMTATLSDQERRRLRGLAYRGLVEEIDSVMRLPGEIWRGFVQDV
jgi:SIR2-like domain